MASIFDYFIGTTQSKYASIAIFSAITVICIAILLTNTDISIGNRIIVIFFILAMCIFPVCISLFELTCIVTGGKKNGKYNICHIYAWVITAMIILYCTVLIIATIASMFTYKKALDKVNASESSNAISHADANTIAKNIIENYHDKDETNHNHHVVTQEHTEPIVVAPPKPVIIAPEPVKQMQMPQSNVIGYDSEDDQYMEVGNESYVQQPVEKKEPKMNSSFNPEPFSNDSFATL